MRECSCEGRTGKCSQAPAWWLHPDASLVGCIMFAATSCTHSWARTNHPWTTVPAISKVLHYEHVRGHALVISAKQAAYMQVKTALANAKKLCRSLGNLLDPYAHLYPFPSGSKVNNLIIGAWNVIVSCSSSTSRCCSSFGAQPGSLSARVCCCLDATREWSEHSRMYSDLEVDHCLCQ